MMQHSDENTSVLTSWKKDSTAWNVSCEKIEKICKDREVGTLCKWVLDLFFFLLNFLHILYFFSLLQPKENPFLLTLKKKELIVKLKKTGLRFINYYRSLFTYFLCSFEFNLFNPTEPYLLCLLDLFFLAKLQIYFICLFSLSWRESF